jgi:shikimate 5-dehydrogenase
MLIEQAALAFETWTSHPPSREMMRASLEQFPTINYRVS